MERAIARFNERITVQKSTVVVDKYHNHMNAWEDYFSCYAYANTYAKDEETEVLTHDERTVIFEVRYCSELAGITSTNYRVVFKGDAYNITNIDMMNYQKKCIRIKCRKEGDHGADDQA